MTSTSNPPRGLWRALWTTAPGFAVLVFALTLGLGWVVRDRWPAGDPEPPEDPAPDPGPERVDTFGVADPRVQDKVRRTLVRIAGLDYGKDVEDWLEWANGLP